MNESLQAAEADLVEKVFALEALPTQLIPAERMDTLGRLAAGVAHEINNPLSIVSGNIKVVETLTRDISSLLPRWIEAAPLFENSSDIELRLFYEEFIRETERLQLQLIMEHQERILSAVQSGVARVARLVADLSQFSEHDDSEMVQTDPVAEMERALNIVHGELKYHTAIVRDFQPLPPIKCHSRRLCQVFINLLLNAAQSIEAQGTITISTRSEPNAVQICVRDTGAGIPEEALALIFDPFYTTKDKGTGLGLSVSAAIIRAHGGQITVESKPSEGSTFTISLPRIDTNDRVPQSNGSAVPAWSVADMENQAEQSVLQSEPSVSRVE